MAQPMPEAAPRSYGCTFGCGNPFDYVFTDVASSETQFLCLPCFVRLASDIVEAATNPDNATVRLAVAEMGEVDSAPVTTRTHGKRGHNAPVTTDDPDIFEAFDGVTTAEELPDAFR